MTSSKFSVSRRTKTTLYSLSSPLSKSSSNLSQFFDRSFSRRESKSSTANSQADEKRPGTADSPPTYHQQQQRTRHRRQGTGEDKDAEASVEEEVKGIPAVTRASRRQDLDDADQDGDDSSDQGSSQQEYTTSRPNTAVTATTASPTPAESPAHSPSPVTQNHKSHPAVVSSLAAESVGKHSTDRQQEEDTHTSLDQVGDEPVLRPRVPKRSRTWANRLSTFIPSLISPTSTDQPSSSLQYSASQIHRKPVGAGDRSSTGSGDPRMSQEGPRHAATFDLGFSSSKTDLSLTNPSAARAHSPAPPPPPPKVSGNSIDETDMPATALTTDIPPLPYRDAPSAPHSADPAVSSFSSGGRLRKENRHSPPSMPPPPVPQKQPESVRAVPPQDSSPPRGATLRKPHPSRRRSSSFQQSRNSMLPTPGIQNRATSPMPARGRSSSAQPPGSPSSSNNRIVSTPNSINSQSPTREDKRGRLRRSWLPGLGSRSNSRDDSKKQNQAWLLGQESSVEYKTSFLLNGEKVPELWNEGGGAVCVHLFPKNTLCGPSFKVPMYAVSSSEAFNDLIQSEMAPGGARQFPGLLDDQGYSPPESPALDEHGAPLDDIKLYIPGALAPAQGGQLAAPGQKPQMTRDEFERLISIRNLFAFLTGQPLVGTKSHPTIFSAFVQVSGLLQEFGFTSLDGSSFGEAVDMSFGFFNGQLALGDVRHSREKTLEALILGERMRSMELYGEAFAHAVGKYTAIMDMRSPLLEQVSPQTRRKLERAHLDLVNRQNTINNRLEQFEFPSLFSGIANSNTIDEVKNVRFNKWRTSFNKMRSFTLGYYKSTFGNWPPKASSKKNPFSESGLNRLVIKSLYSDMCALYDLLVDRENLTSRVVNGEEDDESSQESAMIAALRKVLTEFDNSTPPVLPPIPFDAPQLPSMRAVHETYDKMGPKDRAKFDKKIKEHERILVLHKAYNYDTNTLKIPFLSQFKDFEHQEARGKNAADLADQRLGYWLFLYVVIQSLPMLSIDAPGLQFTDGVEYFLCEPPMGNPPWLEDSRQPRKMWYEVSGGAGYVELSADSVMFSVEAIYHRSHCWAAAKRWESLQVGEEPPPPPPTEDPVLSPLAPPPMFTEQDGPLGSPASSGPGTPGGSGAATPSPPPGSPKVVGRPRTNSPGGRALAARNSAYRSSVALGLEPVSADNFPGGQQQDYRTSRVFSGGSSMSLGDSRMSLPRSRSATNLPIQQEEEEPAPATATMTFDDILGGDDKDKKKKKKMSKFF